ncbi:MAG: ATP-binding protein [Sulfurovum sp.]|nr:ATP-binding protein [Sulfurovum sp.]
MEEIYEKAGLFYLGKDVDRDKFEPTEVLTLLKNKNFTTHAAIIGMTGSGKTGLGVGIIEEAAIDNIPSIVIDPKGDMGNLCLTDPEFRAEHFMPWVKDEAESKGEDVATYAAKIAKMWKDGIEHWGQSSERVAKFARVKKTIFTPGSQSGVPIDLMSSLTLPDRAILEDSDNFAAYLKSSVMGLLSLVGIEADPLDSKEYILLSQLISRSWMEGKSLSIEELVGRIINPSFKKIGVLPLKSFYPSNERFKFATKFNAVIASPNFINWLSGEALDIQKLLYDEEGKAKIAIFSISHLNDDERMFFVTLLLNKYIAWMRLQSGSSRLRTLLYMDEIYGFFPPIKNPPSKEPMITLLKQARAYGIGVVLSTQNPVDLDYKGLSNIGTWCIGRLQTTQDVNRVIDGLGGKIDSSFDKKEIANLLANLRKRTFFLKSAHLEDIRLFGTRWVLSYLKGPLKKAEISALMHEQKASIEEDTPQQSALSIKDQEFGHVNTIDSSIAQHYEIDIRGEGKYRAFLAAKSEVYYHDGRRGIEVTEEGFDYLDLATVDSVNWEESEVDDLDFNNLPNKEPKNAKFAELPEFISTDKALKKASSKLKDHLYRHSRLELYKCRALRMESGVDDELSDFKVAVQGELDERKEQILEELKESYSKKEKLLLDKLSRAKERVEKEKGDQMSSLLNVGASILGALFGRTTATKIGTTINRGSRAYKERGDVSRAERKMTEIEEKLYDLGSELEVKIDELASEYSIDNYEIESFVIKPKKRDINVKDIALVWRAV